MEFLAARSRLHDAFQVVGGVAMLKTLKDVLQNIYVEAADNTLTLKATDYEVGIQVRLPEVDVKQAGVVLVPSAKAVGIFREASEPQVAVKAEGTRLEIRAGKSRFRVVLSDAENFPGLPEFPTAWTVKVPRNALVQMIKHVVFASAEERTRYAFDGIKLVVEGDEMRMVSTDGKRLGFYRVPVERSEDRLVEALLPARAMGHFVKALGSDEESCEIGIEGNRFGVRSSLTEVYCQQIEGSFPNFAPLLEKELGREVTVDVEELMSAVRRASLFAGSESRVVRLKIEAGNLNVNSNVAEVGEAETDLPIEYAGPTVELGFNPDYLLDFLKIVGSGSVRMQFSDEQTASRWSTGESFQYLVMPVSM